MLILHAVEHQDQCATWAARRVLQLVLVPVPGRCTRRPNPGWHTAARRQVRSRDGAPLDAARRAVPSISLMRDSSRTASSRSRARFRVVPPHRSETALCRRPRSVCSAILSVDFLLLLAGEVGELRRAFHDWHVPAVPVWLCPDRRPTPTLAGHHHPRATRPCVFVIARPARALAAHPAPRLPFAQRGFDLRPLRQDHHPVCSVAVSTTQVVLRRATAADSPRVPRPAHHVVIRIPRRGCSSLLAVATFARDGKSRWTIRSASTCRSSAPTRGVTVRQLVHHTAVSRLWRPRRPG